MLRNIIGMVGRGATGGGGGGTDPYWSNVVLSIPPGGTNGDTTATDAKGLHNLTAAGTASVSSAQSKFGGTSLSFGGGYFGCAASSDFDFGTGDFTVEWWGWKSANGASGYDSVCSTESINGSGGTGWVVECSLTRGIYMYGPSAVLVVSATFNPNDSTWHHYAVCRAAGVAYIWKDGVMLASRAFTGSVGGGSAVFGIGGSGVSTTYRYAGYIDDLRITKGVGRYTSAFTPPTGPFPTS